MTTVDRLEELRTSSKLAYTATEASLYFDLDPRTVSRACTRGQIRSFKVGRLTLIPRDEIVRLLTGGDR